jgi:RNA polymerase primary sigma factor
MRKIKTGKPLSERENESLNTYLDEIGKEMLLSDDEEQQLALKIQNGGSAAERAVEKLVTANLRFVVSVAKMYTDNGVAITDLISEGNIGMMKAARSFDGNRGRRFVGYAESFVRDAIIHAINEQSGIYNLPKNENNKEEKENSRAFSVDAPLQNGKNLSLLSILSDPDAQRPDKLVLDESIKAELLESMDVLDDRERRVVQAFYGIGRDNMTFAEIGEDMGLKRERVRQIRDKAVRKLGKNTTNDTLKAYLS